LSRPGCSWAGIIIFCVASRTFRPGLTGRERLLSLGRYFTELGSIPRPEFEEFIRLQASLRVSQLLSSLERISKMYDASPDFWERDVRRYIETTHEALQHKDCIIARDLKEGRTDDEVLQLSQRLVLRFGHLLQVWPEMFEETRRLRVGGRRLALPV